MVRSLLFCAALSMLLTACDWPEPETVEKPYPVSVYVPAELRSCPGLPSVPGPDATQRDVADYIVRLHAVAKECKVNLDTVDQILRDHEATVAASREEG
ncbi:hypothetical protein MAL1_00091 [Bacteriophage DSS3_MAL1]|nr:hypothetical protein MAL1_00091 [Bacteriophage DSS3_MAL1]